MHPINLVDDRTTSSPMYMIDSLSHVKTIENYYFTACRYYVSHLKES